MKEYFVHKKALVESKNIGKNSRIWAFVHILSKAKIGRNANICDFCFIENDVEIGDDVTIKPGVHIWDGIKIEDKVFVGSSAVFTNDLYPRSGNKNYRQGKTLLKKGCSIGANATILANRIIGKNSMIGAGAVVTRDVPDFALVCGNPAEIQGYVCECGTKMEFINKKYKCNCGKSYVNNKNIIMEI